MPVISIGVPTVVDLRTLACDLLGSELKRDAAESFVPRGKNMLVIPNEIDLLTERASRLLGLSLNAAVQDKFELEELIDVNNEMLEELKKRQSRPQMPPRPPMPPHQGNRW